MKNTRGLAPSTRQRESVKICSKCTDTSVFTFREELSRVKKVIEESKRLLNQFEEDCNAQSTPQKKVGKQTAETCSQDRTKSQQEASGSMGASMRLLENIGGGNKRESDRSKLGYSPDLLVLLDGLARTLGTMKKYQEAIHDRLHQIQDKMRMLEKQLQEKDHEIRVLCVEKENEVQAKKDIASRAVTLCKTLQDCLNRPDSRQTRAFLDGLNSPSTPSSETNGGRSFMSISTTPRKVTRRNTRRELWPEEKPPAVGVKPLRRKFFSGRNPLFQLRTILIFCTFYLIGRKQEGNLMSLLSMVKLPPRKTPVAIEKK